MFNFSFRYVYFAFFITFVNLWYDFGTTSTIYEPRCPNIKFSIDNQLLIIPIKINFDKKQKKESYS
jgi:hypothetical protein